MSIAKLEDLSIAIPWTDERKEFIRKQYCGGAPDDIADAFLQICQRRRLAPEEKHIYLVPRYSKKAGKNEYTIQTGIDGYRLLADRTGAYAGSDRPKYTYDPDQNLVEAEVTVWKIVQGVRCPFTAAADMGEYRPTDSFLWDKMPRVMLAKCAEALALRKAFPAELSGIYVQEEMDQANDRQLPPPPPTNIRERIASQARVTEVVNQVLTPEVVAGAKQEIADFRANGMDVRLNLDDKDRPRIEVVDESTGEIVQTMTAEREREVVADTEPELKRAMKFMHASARNKLSEEQMHVVSRAAYGVTSHKDLTVAQLDALGSAYQEVPLSHVNALIEISDVLVNDPGGSDAPMSDAILAAVGEEIRKAGFGPKVRELMRVAYLLAEATMKGRN